MTKHPPKMFGECLAMLGQTGKDQTTVSLGSGCLAISCSKSVQWNTYSGSKVQDLEPNTVGKEQFVRLMNS